MKETVELVPGDGKLSLNVNATRIGRREHLEILAPTDGRLPANGRAVAIGDHIDKESDMNRWTIPNPLGSKTRSLVGTAIDCEMFRPMQVGNERVNVCLRTKSKGVDPFSAVK